MLENLTATGMRRLGLAAGLLVLAETARAQGGSVSSSCASALPTEIRDACQKATDIFTYLAPQLGTTIAGGNLVLGSGGTLGGLPHFSVGVRGTLIAGSVPKLRTANAPSTGAPAASNYETNPAPVGFPAVDAAVGIFGGIPLGLTRVGGIDVLANATYVQPIVLEFISVTPETKLDVNYGVRLGLLQESLVVPGVSVSMMRRGLPKTTITAFSREGSAATDTLQIANFDLETTSYRLTVSKGVVLFGVAAGVGVDKYKAASDVSAAIYRPNPLLPVSTVRFATAAPLHIESEMTRTNYFVDGYVNVLLLKVVAELGMVTGGEAPTFNTFQKPPNASRLYGAFGVRFGF
jgi:hypothetical protein